MDETEFRTTHAQVNERPCAFAKAILSRCGDCSRARKVLIGERETVACLSPAAQARCAEALHLLRDKALFALRLTHLAEPLPHGKEIKVACGGPQGLQAAMGGAAGPVPDIHGLLESALGKFGTLEQFPYSEIVKTVVNYKARRSRR